MASIAETGVIPDQLMKIQDESRIHRPIPELPSTEAIARILSASLGGALLGSALLASFIPVVGALAGATLGALVVVLRTRHAH